MSLYPSPPLFGKALDDYADMRGVPTIKLDGVWMTRNEAMAYRAQIYPRVPVEDKTVEEYTRNIEENHGR